MTGHESGRGSFYLEGYETLTRGRLEK